MSISHHFFGDTAVITNNEMTPLEIDPFPIGVNPTTKTITEQPDIESYLHTKVARNHTAPARSESWIALVYATIERWNIFQQIASPFERTAIIWSGERAEQVATNFQELFQWDNTETALFTERVRESSPKLNDGAFYPGRYPLPIDSTPELAAGAITNRFQAEIGLRYSDELKQTIPLEEIIIIASLIEREAFDFEDMRYISGIIWNRLFIDMPLQLDATLQYVQGKPGTNRDWWPIPKSSDKFIESPYNTYQNLGLPPAPIANPSIEAIIAALNPRNTDCLFYFHDENGEFYCSKTYEEHVAKIKSIFTYSTN